MVFAILYLAIFLNQFLEMQLPFLSNDSIDCHWKISVEKSNSSFNNNHTGIALRAFSCGKNELQIS